jgi:hypothetical protein
MGQTGEFAASSLMGRQAAKLYFDGVLNLGGVLERSRKRPGHCGVLLWGTYLRLRLKTEVCVAPSSAHETRPKR